MKPTGEKLDSMTNKSRGAEPFGLVLLCLSVVGIVALALCIVALAGMAAAFIDAALFGWRPTMDRIVDVVHAAGSKHSILGLRAVLVFSIVVYGAIIVATLVFAHWRGGPTWRDLVGWRAPTVAITDRWVWAIIVAAVVYSFTAQVLLGRIDEDAHLALRIPADRVAALALVALAVVIAPITEELLFRGWIYTGLRYRLGVWPALILSSAVFAFAHYEDTHVYALAVFPVGLALGGLRQRTDSTKASILFHALYNLTAVLLSAAE